MFARRADRVDDRDAGRGTGDAPDRRCDGRRAPGRHRLRHRASLATDRLRPAAAPEPALHARHERVDLRRRIDQLDVLARPSARDAQPRSGVPLPPALPRRRVPDLVRRRRPRLGHRVARGRRHHARRRRRRPHRAGRALERTRGEHPRPEPLRRRRRTPGHRRADAARARGHAPRHGLHVLRPRHRDDVRARRVPDRADPLSTRWRRRRPGRGLRPLVHRRGQGRARRRRPEAGADRRRRVRGRAQPVGRRQQRGRAVARDRRRLRAQRGHQHQARQGGRRGARNRRPGARPRSRRRPLHDLPHLSATPERTPDDHRHRAPRPRRRPAGPTPAHA